MGRRDLSACHYLLWTSPDLLMTHIYLVFITLLCAFERGTWTTWKLEHWKGRLGNEYTLYFRQIMSAFMEVGTTGRRTGLQFIGFTRSSCRLADRDLPWPGSSSFECSGVRNRLICLTDIDARPYRIPGFGLNHNAT
jgi:hypothetical protein